MSSQSQDVVLYEPGAIRPTDVVDVTTGELVSLASPSPDLIALRVRLKGLVAAVQDVNRAIDDEIRARMDKDLRWTVDAPLIGVKASAPSPDRRLDVPDPGELNKLLQQMLDADEITPAAKYAAIEAKPVEYTVKAAGLKALLKRDDLQARLATVVVSEPPARRPVTYK